MFYSPPSIFDELCLYISSKYKTTKRIKLLTFSTTYQLHIFHLFLIIQWFFVYKTSFICVFMYQVIPLIRGFIAYLAWLAVVVFRRLVIFCIFLFVCCFITIIYELCFEQQFFNLHIIISQLFMLQRVMGTIHLRL